MKLTPAEYVIYLIGANKLGRLLGREDGSSVSQWQSSSRPEHLKGTIPANLHVKILEIAKQENVDITPNDLIFGRVIPEREPSKKEKTRPSFGDFTKIKRRF